VQFGGGVTEGCRVQDAARVPGLRGYALRRQRVPVGDRVVSLVVPDARSWRRDGDWLAGVIRGGEPPYWTRIWLSAVAVARLLVRCGDLGRWRVCDLGCGLGLPGIVAASLGGEVTFVDREDGALAFARWNASNSASGARPKTVRLDWARESVAGHFDLMLLADVSYRSLHHGPLLQQIDRCLAPGGVVVHADPVRDEAVPFLDAMRQRGAVALARRSTSFGDQRGEVRLCLAASSRAALETWLPRLGAGLSWEVAGS
jgi:predicted nicotinamide N-methyase